APGVLDCILDLAEAALELCEAFDGAQLRVVLREREERLQRTGQRILRRGLLRRPLRHHRAAARLDDGVQRTAFVRRVALHGLDQVGHEVVAALELNVDVRPGCVRLYVQLDERVVDHEKDEYHRNQDQQRPHSGFIVRDNEWDDLTRWGYGYKHAIT